MKSVLFLAPRKLFCRKGVGGRQPRSRVIRESLKNAPRRPGTCFRCSLEKFVSLSKFSGKPHSLVDSILGARSGLCSKLAVSDNMVSAAKRNFFKLRFWRKADRRIRSSSEDDDDVGYRCSAIVMSLSRRERKKGT